MQKKSNKNKTGEDTEQQVTIVTVPITDEMETSPTKGGTYVHTLFKVFLIYKLVNLWTQDFQIIIQKLTKPRMVTFLLECFVNR